MLKNKLKNFLHLHISKNKKARSIALICSAILLFALGICIFIIPAITVDAYESYADLTDHITSLNATNVSYDSGTNTFSASLELDANINVGEITEKATAVDGYYPFVYKFPDGLIIPEYQLNSDEQYFYVGMSEVGKYKLTKNEDGEYFAIINFNEAYINTHEDSTKLDISIFFVGGISPDSVDEDGNIKILFNTSVSLSVPIEEIVFPEDDNFYYNIDVSKSGSYSIEENTLTYTVTVSSEKGTPDSINLSDTITMPSGVSIENLETITVTKDGTAVDDFTYTYSGNKLNAVLPALSKGEAYTVTYKYKLSSVANGTNATANNTVTATSTDGVTGPITDSAAANIPIRKSLLSKSASYDSTTGLIKWSITVNSSRVDIAGTILSDPAFQDAVGNITVFNNTRGVTAGEGYAYEFVRDENSNITGIKFLPNTRSSGSSENDYNPDCFTISYYTIANSGTNQNTATLDGLDFSDSIGATGSISISGFTMRKYANTSNVTYDSNSNAIIPWTISMAVLQNYGNGQLLFDLIRDDTSSLSDKHYMTKAQIDELYNNVGENSTNDCLKHTDSEHFYVWVNAKDISGSYSSPIIQLTRRPATGTFHMIQYARLLDGTVKLADNVTLESIKYHGFGFYLTSALTAKEDGRVNNITINYSTVCDSTAYTSVSTQRVNNYTEFAGNQQDISVNIPKASPPPGLEKYSVYISEDGKDFALNNSNKVYELTGSQKTVKWAVKVLPYGDDHDSITVVDTLPKGVDLTGLSTGAHYYNSVTPLTIDDNGKVSGERDNVAISGSVVKNSDGTQTVTLTYTPKNPSSVPDWFSNYGSNHPAFYITYTCLINEDCAGYPEAGSSATISLLNQANTYYDNNTDNNTIAVNTYKATVDRRQEVKEIVAKNGSWNNASKKLSYRVDANPYGDDLVPSTAKLEIIDEMTYQDDPTLSISLIMDSVKLYYAHIDTSNPDKIELVKDDEVDVLSWSWTVEEIRDADDDTVTSRITAFIPDSTPVVLEYDYLVQKTESGKIENITNTASIKGTDYSSVVDSGDESSWTYQESGIIVKITPSYTFYKVDEYNYSNTLGGAEFTIFKFDGTEWVSTGITLTTDNANGSFSISSENFSPTAAEESYNNGTLTLCMSTAYYLTETKAPVGYVLPESPPKFYFYYNLTDGQPIMAPYGLQSDDVFSNSVNLAYSSGTEYVKNSRPTTSVTVTKKWVFEDGQAATSYPKNLLVTLKQFSVTKSVADALLDDETSLDSVLRKLVSEGGSDVQLVRTSNHTLSDANLSDGKWKYTWESLPIYGTSEDDDTLVYYYYTVEEHSPVGWVESYNVATVISDDDNEEKEFNFVNALITYELPETGGSGTEIYLLLGSLITASALILILYRKKFRNGGAKTLK